MTSATPGRRDGRSLPRLHAVTNDEVLARVGWEEAAIGVLEAGGADLALHIRGRGTGSRVLHGLATSLVPHARRAGASLFVNDRVDVALVAEVDGVHLRGESLPLGNARDLLGAHAWVGVSRRDVDGVAAAEVEGADYAFLGTIFPTASHPGLEAIGITVLSEAVGRAQDLPVLAIGGVGPGAVTDLVGAGAYGVAAIRGIWDAADPAVAVRRYLEGVGNRRGQK